MVCQYLKTIKDFYLKLKTDVVIKFYTGYIQENAAKDLKINECMVISGEQGDKTIKMTSDRCQEIPLLFSGRS